MGDNDYLNHENMREPYSLNFNDIMCTYDIFAKKIGEKITYNSQQRIDKELDKLQEEAIRRLERGDPNWEISEKEFKKLFSWKLEIFGNYDWERKRNKELLRDHLDIEEDRDITLYDIWKYTFEIGGIDYGLDLKLAILNGKLEQFVKDKEEKGIDTSYQNLLKGTQLHGDFRDSKKEYVDKMLRILSILTREGYIGKHNLEKMIDYYSWTKVKMMWDLDIDYPEFTHDLWIFDIGYP